MTTSAGLGRQPPPGGGRKICDVWSWNFDAEFSELIAAAAACGEGAVLGLDTEFPGFLHEEPTLAGRAVRYQSLRENVNNLQPIQLGVAVAGEDGSLYGVWSFNLQFDVAVDLHTEASVAFLTAAGVDFPRHATEGIDPALVGRRLAASPLVGRSGSRPRWITFQGWYDFGYLLKLIRRWPLPQDVSDFDTVLAAFFPNRHELRDALPRGSLDSLARDYGVKRFGAPHTAGSDALATIELFLQVETSGTSGVPRPAPQPTGGNHQSGRGVWEAPTMTAPEAGGWQDAGPEFMSNGGWEMAAAAVSGQQAQLIPAAQMVQPAQMGAPQQVLQPMSTSPMVPQVQPFPQQRPAAMVQSIPRMQPVSPLLPTIAQLLQPAALVPQGAGQLLQPAQLLHSMVLGVGVADPGRDWYDAGVDTSHEAWAVPLPHQWGMAGRYTVVGHNAGTIGGLMWGTAAEHMPDLATVQAG